MQRAKGRRTIPLPARITNDDALGCQTRLDLQPRVRALARLIGAVPQLHDYAFETQLSHRLEKRRAIFDDVAESVGGIVLNRILQPFPSANQRLVHNRPSIQVEAVEQVTCRGSTLSRPLDGALRLLLH